MAEPDPKVVLKEAEAATKAGRYEEALEKHVWYHENALRIQPSQGVARLYDALWAWYGLGKLYPPALVKLRAVRDETVQRIRGQEVEYDPFVFLDVVALNDLLDEAERTVELFRWLEANRPHEAKQAYFFVREVLVAQGEYALCGRYMNPETEFQFASTSYSVNLQYADLKRVEEFPQLAERIQDFAGQMLSYQTCAFVALLVLNNRRREAEEFAAKVKEIWDDAKFHASLGEALEGVVPEQWPRFARQPPWEEGSGDA